MLNGSRKEWYYNQRQVLINGPKEWHSHPICPSTWHFSAITNNSFSVALALALIPFSLLVIGGVLLIVWVSWLIGVAVLLSSMVPLLAVGVRYAHSVLWNGGEDIRYVESAFRKMPKHKQREYAKFLEAAHNRSVNLKKTIQLFKSAAERGISHELDNELEVQQRTLTIMSSIGE